MLTLSLVSMAVEVYACTFVSRLQSLLCNSLHAIVHALFNAKKKFVTQGASVGHLK